MGVEWPLVGRTAELRHLRDALVGASRQGVVLAGPAGVGKTRLAVEALGLAERAGLATVRVTGTRSASGLPFGALAPLLPAATHGDGTTADHPSDLLRRSTDAILARAEGRRLVVLVDDAHLLDDASATLVHGLASMSAASLVATVRAGEPAPDSIVALWKDGLAERLDLGGLRREAVEEVLTSALGGPVDGATATHLAVRCQGNVLFLRELVLGALTNGRLRDDGGIWHLTGSLEPSDRLIELVEARLGELSPAERTVLELVSFGEPMGQTELMALTDPDIAERLERRGLLDCERSGHRFETRLGHPLYGDVLRARLPAMRIPAIARRLAETIEATGARRREDILRIARWRLDAGGSNPDLMMAAATMARWRYDFPLAERLARVALESGPRFDATLLAAQMASLQGRGSEAAEELTALANTALDDDQRGALAIARSDTAFILGRIGEAVRIAEEAEGTIADPAWRDEIAARRAGLMLGTDGPRAADAAMEPIRERAQGRALVWACLVGAYSQGRFGHIEAAIEASARGHAAHLALERPFEWYSTIHLFLRCEALAHAGRFAESDALATAQYQQAITERSTESQCFFAYHLGKSVGDRGRVRTAERRLREAGTLWHQLGRPQLAQEALLFLALTHALAGRADKAREALGDLASDDRPPMLYTATVVDLLHVRAWTAVAGGDIPTARKTAEQAVTAAEAVGDRVGQAAALHTLARLGDAKAVASLLATVAAGIEGVLAPARAAHALALAEQDAPKLAAVSADFEAMGAGLLAAEAAADAAVAWKRAGEGRDAAAAEHRAGTLAAQYEGAVTPAPQAIETRAHLTPAEREAALLAAGGRSNREIAEELFLSVRTVENRLQRVYEKLGVSGRSDLADILTPTGRP